MALPMFDELLDPARVPHRAMRAGETLLKRQLFALENRTVLEQQRLYREAYRNLRAAALDIADQQGVTKLDHSAGATQFRDQYLAYAEHRLAVLFDMVQRSTIRAAQTALVGGYYGRLWLLDMVTSESTPIRKPILNAPGVLNEDLYDDLIQSLMGRKWRDQYANELGAMTLEVRRAIGNGMLDGQGIDEVMRRVARSMGVITDRRRGSPGSSERAAYRANFNRVQAITRTTINEVSNAGAVNAYRANEDVLEGYSWLTAKDERVCPLCAALDGRYYDLDEKVRPPRHPNCRCTVVPVLRAKMLTDEDGLPRTPIKLWARQNGMEGELADFLKPTGVSMRAPIRRAPRGAAPLPTPKPGNSLSSGMKNGGTTSTEQDIIQRAYGNIDSVHSMGDLTVTEHEVRFRSDYPDSRRGQYSSLTNEISVRTGVAHPASTIYHEAGHLIDYKQLPPESIQWKTVTQVDGKQVRVRTFTPLSEVAANPDIVTDLDEWFDAVLRSPEIDHLMDMMEHPQNYTTTQMVNGVPYEVAPDMDHMRYMLSPNEMFARSYAQYIAEEVGDADTLQYMNESSSGFYPYQWSTQSFAPIRAAFNQFFSSRGWR